MMRGVPRRAKVLLNPLGAVIMQDFEVHPATGKAENNKDPSFGLVTIDVGENRSEDVGLTVGERRLNRLEDIGDICFEHHEGYLIQLDASRAGLL